MVEHWVKYPHSWIELILICRLNMLRVALVGPWLPLLLEKHSQTGIHMGGWGAYGWRLAGGSTWASAITEFWWYYIRSAESCLFELTYFFELTYKTASSFSGYIFPQEVIQQILREDKRILRQDTRTKWSQSLQGYFIVERFTRRHCCQDVWPSCPDQKPYGHLLSASYALLRIDGTQWRTQVDTLSIHEERLYEIYAEISSYRRSSLSNPKYSGC